MKESLLQELTKTGLSNKEALIYLALIEMGTCTAGSIARSTKQKRPTTYMVLGSLIEKGLVEEIKKNGVSYFSSKNPKTIVNTLKEKVYQFEQLLPFLYALQYNNPLRTTVHYLEGVEGLRELFNDFSSSEVNIKTIMGDHKKYNQVLVDIAQKAKLEREKKGLLFKRIVGSHNTQIIKEMKEDKKHARETMVAKFPSDFKGHIDLYGPNKISLFFFDEKDKPHAIVIENKELYDTLNVVFDYIWKDR